MSRSCQDSRGEDFHRVVAFSISGGFSLLRTAPLFGTDVSSSFPRSAGTRVSDVGSCGSSSFFSVSVQPFCFGPEEHPRIPPRQTDFLTSVPLDPGADVASWPQWDVWTESLLRMSRTWNADRCCRSST